MKTSFCLLKQLKRTFQISNFSNGLSIWVSHSILCSNLMTLIQRFGLSNALCNNSTQINGSMNTTPFMHSRLYMTHKGWNFCVTIFGKDTSSYMVTFWIYICPQNFMWWTCGWMQYYKFYGALTPKIFQKILNILQYLLIRLVKIVLPHSWSSRCLL